MTWLKLLGRRQNHQSSEMVDRHSTGSEAGLFSSECSAPFPAPAIGGGDATERRASASRLRVCIESTSSPEDKTRVATIVAIDPKSSFEAREIAAKPTRTAQKVRPSSSITTTTAATAPAVAKSAGGGGSKSRDRRQRCSSSVQATTPASRRPATMIAAGQKVAEAEESMLVADETPPLAAETKELRLPKLVQEQHEATTAAPITTDGGRVWCHCTKTEDENDDSGIDNSHRAHTKSTSSSSGKSWPLGQGERATLRAKQILTNCQEFEMMKVAPRATSFYCDKTPALTFAPARRPPDGGSKTSQRVVVEEDEDRSTASELELRDSSAAFVTSQLKQEQKERQKENNKRRRPFDVSSSSVLFKPARLKRRRESRQQQEGRRRRREQSRSLAIPALASGGRQAARLQMLIANCCLLLVMVALFAGRDAGLAAGAEPPRQRITVQPDPVIYVAAGQQVKLPCQVSNRQGDCAWLGTGGRIVSPSGRKYIFARSPADGDCSILIRNASVQADDGYWQCQVLSVDSEPDMLQQSSNSKLVVLVPPEKPQIKDLSQRTNRLILEEKKEKNITCEIRGGNPAPLIEWYLDGKPMNQNAQTIAQEQKPLESAPLGQRLFQSRLLLNSVKRSMNGKNLTCVGVHQTQNQSTSIELDVQYVPSASLAQKEYTLVEGSPLTVPCLVDANPPASHITWRFISADYSGPKGEAIMTAKTGPVLEMNQVTRAYNRVLYECLAQNSLGISRPAEMRLNVLYPPRALNATESGHVFVGTSKQLQCAFDGNPQPEIKWFYQDPLSRSAASALIDNSRDFDQQPKSLADQQWLTIRNVTYRNEGEYICEARNTINGQVNMVRSIPINLDVFGEPQFLAKSPVYAKAVQGSKSDISLTFCADPPPTKVYWQFGSIRVEVKIPTNGADQRVPSVGQSQLGGRHQQALNSRFQTQPLQTLQRRDSNFSKPPTCFESVLTLVEPEMNDQRDYTLMVQNDQGVSSGFVRVRVTSPLSPALMITSAFVFICGLFLCSLLFLFIFKKRQQFMSGARRANNGSAHSGQANGSAGSGANSNERRRVSRKDKNLLVGQGELANGANATTKPTAANQLNGHQQQTKGVVNGAANGLANSAANPAAMNNVPMEDGQATGKGLTHGLMSMASSDTSCNDQKQLLASNCSDRNSSVGGDSSSGAAIGVGDHYHHNISNTMTSNSGSTDRSTANSSPSQMNHISVDDELNLNGTYQATEPITRGAKLSPPLMTGGPQALHHLNGQSALIYANIDYTNANRRHGGDEGEEQANGENELDYNGASSNRQDLRNQRQHSPEASTVALSKLSSSTATRRRQQTPQLSPNGSISTVQENFGNQQQQQQAQELRSARESGSPMMRPSVGATIALMNSLAAAQSAAAAVNSSVNGAGGNQTAGALNGAISQQLMANTVNRIRKPGPPKPPKPSIQQRSRFYQQQQQQQAGNGHGLVMIGDSQMGTYPMGAGDHLQKIESDEADTGGPNDLAAEYSRLAFPARAEL